MFEQVQIKDTQCIPANQAHTLHKDTNKTLRHLQNIKYSNKILSTYGQVIAIHSIQSHSVANIKNGDSDIYIHMHFRIITFKPFESEILLGKIKQSTNQGIYVSLDFFDHIFIPCKYLPQPCHFDTKENVWIWDYQGTSLYIDINTYTRVRVKIIIFSDQQKCNKLQKYTSIHETSTNIIDSIAYANIHGYILHEDSNKNPTELQNIFKKESSNDISVVDSSAAANDVYVPPMEIIASMDGPGLGQQDWWH